MSFCKGLNKFKALAQYYYFSLHSGVDYLMKITVVRYFEYCGDDDDDGNIFV